jgi:hypothetical protein
VQLVVILIAVSVVVTAAFALAAVRAAGESESVLSSGRFERAAIWQTGYASRDLQLLAGMSAVAHAELDAGEIEVVLAQAGGSGDGVVVTGSRLPPGRVGSPVARGEGLAGRALAGGRTTFAGYGMAAPIVSGDDVVGAVTATVPEDGRVFGTWHVRRLEALAADAGRRLGLRAVAGVQRDA